jgi:hypothetical protein
MSDDDDFFGAGFEAFTKVAKMADKDFTRKITSVAELKKLDRSQMLVSKPTLGEINFEVAIEVPPIEKQTEHEKRYWSIRIRTKLPKAYFNMAWVHVSPNFEIRLIHYYCRMHV